MLSGVIKRRGTSPRNTFSLTPRSICASPTNSACNPLAVYLAHWSIIRDVSGLMHTTILPDVLVTNE